MLRHPLQAPSSATTLRLLAVVSTLCGIGTVVLFPALVLGVVLADSPMRAAAQTALCAAAMSGAAWGLLSPHAAQRLGQASALAMAVMYGTLATGAAWSSAALSLQAERSLPMVQALSLTAVAAVAGLPGFIALRRALSRFVSHLRAEQRS